MNELFDKFKHYLVVEKYVSDNTVQAYTRDINQFLDFAQNQHRITSFNQLKNDHVKDFLKHLKQKVKIGPKSASRKLSALKTLANYLFKYHQISPFTKGVAFPRLPKQLPKNLTEEQIESILKVASEDMTPLGYRNKVMICLLYACGMRVSELTKLEVVNVNFEEQYIQVFGKGSKERIVPLPEEMVVVLQNYLQHIHPRLTHSEQTEYLFPVVYAGKIEHITRQALWKIVKNIAHKAGLVHSISPHVLRHSLATHLLKKGANLRILQTLLGHEKLNTVQVYTHLDVTHLQELYDKYHPRSEKFEKIE